MWKVCVRWSALSALLVGACGGDDGAGQPCPEGALAGAMLECLCDDGTSGVSTCGEELTLSPCACTSADEITGGDGDGDGTAVEDGDGDAPAGGPPSGDGDDDGMTADDASGDGGGPAAGDDATEPGEPSDDGADDDDGAPAVSAPPSDGTVLALCEDDRDCNSGLGCYSAGPGVGFCSPSCEDDDACADMGGGFTCSVTGVCVASCEGPDDAGCPDQMVCTDLAGLGLPPLPGTGVFACKYPERIGQVLGAAFAACMVDDDCEAGLSCSGASPGAPPLVAAVPGHCTSACERNDECAGPQSGTIPVTCEPDLFGGICALDCFGDAEGCPDGMVCLTGGLGSRCGYP